MLHSIPCFAVHSGYSKDWFQTDLWYGDWPNGFSVVRNDAVVPMHSMVMKGAKADLKCKLPQNAVFHVWNVDRSVMWNTWSEIARLKINQNFNYKTYDRKGKILNTQFYKNEFIEYLIYEDDEFALIRYRGAVMEIDHDFLSYVTHTWDLDIADKDQWFYVACENGTSGWIKYADMIDRSGRFLKGLDSWTLGLKAMGEVHDLTP